MNIDPTATIEDKTGKFVIICAINPADNKPYTLTINPTNGELKVGVGLPISTNGKSLTLTGGIDQLPALALKSGLVIEADEDNANDVWVGGSAVAVNDGFRLSPGESVPVATENQNTVYVIGTVTQKVHYLSG